MFIDQLYGYTTFVLFLRSTQSLFQLFKFLSAEIIGIMGGQLHLHSCFCVLSPNKSNAKFELRERGPYLGLRVEAVLSVEAGFYSEFLRSRGL